MSTVNWYIAMFEKTGNERRVGRIETTGVDAEFIRQVWSLPDDDPGYGLNWPVTPENITQVQEHALEDLDLSAYHYMLSDETIHDSGQRDGS